MITPSLRLSLGNESSSAPIQSSILEIKHDIIFISPNWERGGLGMFFFFLCGLVFDRLKDFQYLRGRFLARVLSFAVLLNGYVVRGFLRPRGK